MNRLWVRMSLVIAGIVIFVALLPFALRTMTRDALRLPPPVEARIPSLERSDRLQRLVEERIWLGVTRTLLFGTGIGLIASVFLSRWLVAPLNRIEQGTRAVAERRLDYRVAEVGSQEMRSVARSFNRMATELERQETLRRNLLADVAHELRHPVHVLRGSLQAILDGVYPLTLEEIALMLEQTQHLATLVEDLHALALAEAHELPLHRQMTDVGVLAQESADAMLPLAEERHLDLRVTRPPKTLRVAIDPQRVRQALQNLLGNAIRYTPEHGQVSVTVTHTDAYVTIIVQDTGIGITGDELPHVFDRFYRGGAGSSRAAGGTGLGLAIVKAIAEAHGGRVTAHSPGPNQGSTFTLFLPLDNPAHEADL